MKKLAYLLLGLAVLAGCSTSPATKLAKDDAEAAKIRAETAADQRARQQAQMETNLSKVPLWALQPPAPDDTGVYAVGIGDSNKMRIAMRKAMLDAEFGLAKNINQELSGSERSYTRDENGTVGRQQYTELVDKLVMQVPVVGFEVVKQEIRPIDGAYNAFILLKLPYDQFNRVLQDQRAKADDQTIQKAFDDLQNRINVRRQQKLDDAKQQQAQDAQAQTAPPPSVTTQPLPQAAQAPQPAPQAEQAAPAEQDKPAAKSSQAGKSGDVKTKTKDASILSKLESII